VKHAARLVELVRADARFMEILRAVREVNPPSWVVGAGALRNLVWDELHDRENPTPPTDVVVALFDDADVTSARDRSLEAALAKLLPGVPWEVTNQAGVHLWYEEEFGHSITPITSVEDGVARWPETATAVAVRLERDASLTVVAPCGLDDLFSLVMRRNDRQVTAEHFRQRVEQKRIRERWPLVTVLE
jgi:hypothetical protein